MKIIKVESYDKLSVLAAEIVTKQIKKKHNSTIVFPSGSTPEGMYKILSKSYANNLFDWSKIIAINLDEYIEIKMTNPLSYHTYMNNNLYNNINIDPNNIHIPNGYGDIEKNINDFRTFLNSQEVIDLAILGIGVNGHIGFNEPGSNPNSEFRKVKLSNETLEKNKRFFGNDKSLVPKYALSMGLKDILRAKKIILLASGRTKANAIKMMIKEKVSKECPASFLQTHKNVIIIVDEAASVYV